jgi:hypothetical protein
VSSICPACGDFAGVDVAVCPECGFDIVGRDGDSLGPTIADDGARGARRERQDRPGGRTVFMHEDTVAGRRDLARTGMLVVRTGPDGGRTFELGDSEMLGRDRSCSIQLTDRRVSGVHGHVKKQGSLFIYQDLQATNSTFLVRDRGRERRLTAPHTLRDGDELRVGDTILRFVDLNGGRRR